MSLRSDRLLLRPFRSDDVAAFEGFACSDAYLRYVGDDHPEPRAFVANNVDVEGSWVIVLDFRALSRLGFEAVHDRNYRLRRADWRGSGADPPR